MKEIVEFFKKSNLMSLLETKLKQSCTTRWIIDYFLIKSIFISKANIEEIITQRNFVHLQSKVVQIEWSVCYGNIRISKRSIRLSGISFFGGMSLYFHFWWNLTRFFTRKTWKLTGKLRKIFAGQLSTERCWITWM